MSEKDYEVNENGDRLPHRHQITVDEFFNGATATKDQRTATAKKNQRTATATENGPPLKRAKSSQKLPKVLCPECDDGTEITVKGLARHIREKHRNLEKLVCDLCTTKPYTAYRERSLQDHKRRIHFEPVPKGRARKNEKKRRERSPFRMDNFNRRHKESSEILKSKAESTLIMADEERKKIDELREKLEKTESDNIKNENRLKALEEARKKTEIDTRLVKSRVAIMESKHLEFEIPEQRDVRTLLECLNLPFDCTKEDIRKTINLRLMELSSESVVSNEIFTFCTLTPEKRQQISMFLNEASQTLLKWKKNTAKSNSTQS